MIAAVADIFGATVDRGPVPPDLPAPLVDLPWLQANAAEAILHVAGVGRFHVRNGGHVTVDADRPVESWLRGIVAALVLAQRGEFALHASTVQIGGRLVALTGRSGAGKSTTACLLTSRGHTLVTDDVTPVGVDGTVQPSGRRLHLWPATATRLGLPDGDPVGPNGEKRAYAIPAGSYAIPAGSSAARLGLVVALRPCPDATVPAVRRLTGAAAVEVLAGNTYLKVLRRLDPVGHLRWVTALAGSVDVVRIERPAVGWSADQVAAAIEGLARPR